MRLIGKMNECPTCNQVGCLVDEFPEIPDYDIYKCVMSCPIEYYKGDKTFD